MSKLLKIEDTQGITVLVLSQIESVSIEHKCNTIGGKDESFNIRTKSGQNIIVGNSSNKYMVKYNEIIQVLEDNLNEEKHNMKYM